MELIGVCWSWKFESRYTWRYLEHLSGLGIDHLRYFLAAKTTLWEAASDDVHNTPQNSGLNSRALQFTLQAD